MRKRYGVAAAFVLGFVTVLASCGGGASEVEPGALSVEANLEPAVDAGLAVDAVVVTLEGAGDPIVFDLVIDAAAQAASGTQQNIPPGDYVAGVALLSGADRLGAGSRSVQIAAADTTELVVTIEVTITTSDPSDPDDPVDPTDPDDPEDDPAGDLTIDVE